MQRQRIVARGSLQVVREGPPAHHVVLRVNLEEAQARGVAQDVLNVLGLQPRARRPQAGLPAHLRPFLLHERFHLAEAGRRSRGMVFSQVPFATRPRRWPDSPSSTCPRRWCRRRPRSRSCPSSRRRSTSPCRCWAAAGTAAKAVAKAMAMAAAGSAWVDWLMDAPGRVVRSRPGPGPAPRHSPGARKR